MVVSWHLGSLAGTRLQLSRRLSLRRNIYFDWRLSITFAAGGRTKPVPHS